MSKSKARFKKPTTAMLYGVDGELCLEYPENSDDDKVDEISHFLTAVYVRAMQDPHFIRGMSGWFNEITRN